MKTENIIYSARKIIGDHILRNERSPNFGVTLNGEGSLEVTVDYHDVDKVRDGWVSFFEKHKAHPLQSFAIAVIPQQWPTRKRQLRGSRFGDKTYIYES
jgi:hypothetical protein